MTRYLNKILQDPNLFSALQTGLKRQFTLRETHLLASEIAIKVVFC